MIRRRFALALLSAVALSAANGPWKWADLEAPPQTFEAPHQDEPGVKAIWFAGVPYKGKPTRVFAYYGAPTGDGKQKFPAMVLIHGGGGTAFAEWVRMWNARGYAAIAMDTTGAVPAKAVDDKTMWNPQRTRNQFSGPTGWGDYANVDLAPEDEWSYHAVAAAIGIRAEGVDQGDVGVPQPREHVGLVLKTPCERRREQADPHDLHRHRSGWGFLPRFIDAAHPPFRKHADECHPTEICAQRWITPRRARCGSHALESKPFLGVAQQRWRSSLGADAPPGG